MYNIHPWKSSLMWFLSKSMTVTSTTPSEVVDVIAHSLSVLDHWVVQLLLCSFGRVRKELHRWCQCNIHQRAAALWLEIWVDNPMNTALSAVLKLHWDLFGRHLYNDQLTVWVGVDRVGLLSRKNPVTKNIWASACQNSAKADAFLEVLAVAHTAAALVC